MSKAFRDQFGENEVSRSQIREFLRPKFRRDEDGKPIYVTEQAHKERCNVNNIIRKYDKTGLITHVSNMEYSYGDMTSMDFKTAQDRLAKFRSEFNGLPSQIRKRFENKPENFLEFMENPANRQEAEKMGLINPMWTDETDGIGEHVKDASERKLKDQVDPKEPS